ncbi:MAG: hypothetical protein GX575_11485 [Candidatus Anammoximicrobium sp.]|nr:hypothetical protein [Candidatus Anammoximicrobium sp.]
MSDEKKHRPEIEEVVTEFDGGVRLRSGFQMEALGPGVVSFNLFGPVFECDDGDDLDDDDEGDEEPEPRQR